ncbi:MAG: chromosome segregation protein SMC [Candidatus Omnitrophota bacterium]
MHFKKLELFGFKSFADKTNLHFEPGVTAIVGPNGCGKSNILDSIRWVMGEQNPRDLRGLAMADIIFSGSDKKEALNFAEVSLTLSNEARFLPIEYDEVTVTRRLFRSGESEYLLNKMPVRLKDITELFMDTGLGSGGFWVMEQGKMDLILSSRPEDRRSVFEEASGINKYKSKKKEALRKLEQTEQNLLRLSDIIGEVKRQINSIERQAQKAKKYKELFEQLKAIDVKLGLRSHGELKQQRRVLGTDRDALKAKEEELAHLEANVSQKFSLQRWELEDVSNKLSHYQNEIVSISSAIERNTDRVNLDTERIEELESRQEALGEEIRLLAQKLEALKVRIDELRAKLNEIENERKIKVDGVGQKENLLQEIIALIAKTNNDMARAKLDTVDIASKETRTKNELAKLGAEMSNLSARLRRLGVEKEKIEQDTNAIKEKYDAAVFQQKTCEDNVATIRGIISQLETKLNAQQEELKALDKEFNDAETLLASKSAKLESLEEMHKRREGFSCGVRFLMQQKESGTFGISGVHGVVADLIEVKRGYEEAIEAALGENAQAIVVDSEASALEAMKHLANNAQGKAKFICLERLETKNQKPKTKNENEALNYIKFNSTHGSLLGYLFDGISIAENMEAAIGISRQNNALCRIVTKAGEIIEGASIIGGSRQEASIIGRESKIKDLQAEVSALKEKSQELKAKKESLAVSLEALKKDLDAQNAALKEGEIDLANKNSILGNIGSEQKKLEDEYSLIILEFDETKQQDEECKVRQENLKCELANHEKARIDTEDFLNQAQELISGKGSEKEQLLVEIAEMRTELNLIQQREANQSATLSALEASYKADLDSKAAKEKEIEDSRSKIGTLTKEISELEALNVESASKKQALDCDSEKFIQQKNELAQCLSKYEAELSGIHKNIDTIRNSIRDIEVKDAQLGFEEMSLKDRISQAYQVDLEQVEPPSPEEDWDTFKQNAEKLREKLNNMGTVNLVAIEEEKELTDRYNFLTAQEADLSQAKESLTEAIRKINRTTKELFLDGFQKVQVTFKEYFRMLFGGGDAELVILDESDILESGIEIVVRPPGKKLQNISLLSGGERALCATALLFAIFKVKPSPFCILDEIDAPLDESNIDRFTKVLQDFVRTSQFIIITHNKKTISVADVMYGVTMEESGISKLVSVKFQENELKAATA